MRSGGGVKIGRLFGINIRIDWSWFLIFFLVTWNLSSVFGNYHSEWSAGLRWGLAIGSSLLFFASVLAHEMAHSLVARARGIPVRNITLFLFGGVSSIQREPPSAGTEFIMAILGPVTSLVIGAALIFITASVTEFDVLARGTAQNPAELLGQFGPLQFAFLWLGSVNVLLGFFNLIPGFPLDGGRVVRSIFWALTDDLRRATRWASWIGQGIGWMMILGGISAVFGVQIPFFGAGFLNGLWLIIIGWFLQNAATRSYRRVVIQDVLEEVPVRRMMLRDPPTVRENISVDTLIDNHIMQTDDQAFPVLDEGGSLVGVVTLTDVRSVPNTARGSTTVAEIMTPKEDLSVVDPEDDAGDAFQDLAQRDVRQLPVVSEGQLVGLVRRRDVVRWLQLQSDLELG